MQIYNIPSVGVKVPCDLNRCMLVFITVQDTYIQGLLNANWSTRMYVNVALRGGSVAVRAAY